jgi:glycosyltransferase involved in cell wall biosynthesis
MKPVISVVIATFRRVPLLVRCLQALANQQMDKRAYEIIIVTDGPDEATVQRVREWQQSCPPNLAVTCLSLPQKKGPAAARNAGWRAACGELIVFTDDDCIPHPDFLEQYWQAYELYRPAAIAFSGQVIVPLPEVPTDYEKNIGQLQQARFVTANCACTYKALLHIGGLDESFGMAWREDTALEFDLHEHGIPIIKVASAVVEHPVRTAPWGVSIKEQKKSMYNALLYKKHTALYKQTNTGQTPRYYYIITALLLLAVIFLFTNSMLTLWCLTGWALLTGWFALKRLNGTSRHPRHVTEMICTSAVIPILSVYWNLYGAIKFKTFYV